MLNYHDAMQNVANLQRKQEAIVALAEDEKRELSDTENAELDALENEISKAQANADRIKKIEDRAKQLSELTPAKTTPVLQPENRITIPASQYRGGKMKGFANNAEGELKAYRAGRWLAAALYNHQQSIQWCKDNGLDPQNALTTGDNLLGGVLVPAEFEQAVIDLKEERGVFAREARRVTMNSDTKVVPNRSSGLTAYFVGDNTEITASDKNWTDVNLVAKKCGVLVRYSSELNEDAVIDLADDLAGEIAYAFADKEDTAGFTGTGLSTDGGIVGIEAAVNAGSVFTAATGNTAFETLDLLDFEKTAAKLPQWAQMNAKWYIHSLGYWESMARLANAGGGNTTETLGDGPNQRMFMGYPVQFVQVLNSTSGADTSDEKCIFGDLRQSCLYGSRRDLRLDISTDRYFELDQLAIKGTCRFDIVVHSVGTATEAGGVIVLKTPAS